MTPTESLVLDLAVAYRRAYANYSMLHDRLQPRDGGPLCATVKASLVPVHKFRDELDDAADALLAERLAAEPPPPYAALEPEPHAEPIHLEQVGPV